ncbi:MAG: mucoidy inhibitor MuiA family protein, partial [Bacteroidota bacterium]
FFCWLLATLTVHYSFAQELVVSTSIQAATVYRQTAQVTRTGKFTIPKGRGTLVLKDLSPQLDHNSVRIGATGDFYILAVTPRYSTPPSVVETDKYQELQKKRQRLDDAIAREQIKIDVLQTEEKVMRANKAVSGSGSELSVDELQKMAAYVRLRLGEIRNEIFTIQQGLRADQNALATVDQELQQLRQTQSKRTTEVVVQYQAERTVNAEFQLNYLVNGVNWSPTYDLRVAQLTQPVELAYGALVTQQTGENWKNVQLTLSTGNPRQQLAAPVITTWWLNPNRPLAQAAPRPARPENAMSNMIIRTEEVEDARYPGAEVAVNLTNTEFRVRARQDVPSNGQQYRVAIDEYELPADYQYYAAPRLDPHVYLTARVTDWEKYSLQTGPVNLFFDGSYVGNSTLSAAVATDTLVFSLGRDKGWTIQRERDDDYRSRKLLGTKTERRVGWTIKVKKNRDNKVPLLIEDQIPVSTSDQIEVELDQAKGGKLNPQTGIIRWELRMKYGDRKEIDFRYKVRHPKSLAVYLE